MSGAARVLLVGFQDQENLGLGYLAGSLKAAGHAVCIESFARDASRLLSQARQWQPDIVGFSLIFQFLAPDFAETLHALRQGGVAAHFTMGGHYASFAPEALFALMPELDSIVRFEGEHTLVELAAAIAAGRPWREVRGIVWRDGTVLHTSPPRQAVTDLDTLPWPERPETAFRRNPVPTASLLASRGCLHSCSFCSIVPFYQNNGTRGRRRRNPVRVADEIEHLNRRRGVRLVLFQDDDFLAGGRDARKWALSLAHELIRRGLHRRIRFRIACRSDEVREEVLAPLVEAGLANVYLGVESGDAEALLSLNKKITADVHFRAGEILRGLGLSFDFGFMLLEPWSTRVTVRNNLRFLREFCTGGYAAAGFCRALPYAGTPMEKRMRVEGRLEGAAFQADYRFLDQRLDTLWDFSLVAFAGRNYGKNAVWDLLRGLLFEARLDFPDRPHDPGFLATARTLTEASNNLMLDIAEEALDRIERMEKPELDDPALLRLARLSREENERIRDMVSALWNARPQQADEELRA